MLKRIHVIDKMLHSSSQSLQGHYNLLGAYYMRNNISVHIASFIHCS